MTQNGKLLKDTIAGLSKPSRQSSKNSGLLSKTVTCQGCGHSWKAVDGGADVMACHNCGGMVTMAKGGQMIKRADGSSSPRGMWDNIRENAGSGKKPTKEMLKQERKIRAEEMKYGGINNPGFEALPDYVQANILSHMGYGGMSYPLMQDGGEQYIDPSTLPQSFADLMAAQKPGKGNFNIGYNTNKFNASYNYAGSNGFKDGTHSFDVGIPAFLKTGNLNMSGNYAPGKSYGVNMSGSAPANFVKKGTTLNFNGGYEQQINPSMGRVAPTYNLSAGLNIPTRAGKVTVNASYRKEYGGEQEAIPQIMAYGGSSVVDYLNTEGMDSDKAARAEYARKLNIKDYDYSAAKNLELLAAMKAAGKAPAPAKPVAKAPASKVAASATPASSMYRRSDMVGNERMPANFKAPQKAVANSQTASGKNTSVNTEKMMFSGNIKTDEKNLESGMVVDKRSNTGYIVKGGKVVKSFPVLTGKNPEGTSSPWSVSDTEGNDSRKVTPAGTYTMNINPDYPDIYGATGFYMNPVSAFNEPAPIAKNLAVHQTYDPANRNMFYNMSPDQRYQSYGCINCRNPDMADLVKEFPKSDTLMVLDPLKNKRDMDFLKKVTGKKAGGNIYDDGGPVDPPFGSRQRAAAESTGVAKPIQMTAAELKKAQLEKKANKQKEDQQRLANRDAEYQRRADVISKRDSLMKLPLRERLTAQNVADITAAGLEDMRVRPDLTTSDKGLDQAIGFADEYLNPARWMYGAANAIGSLPYNVGHGNKLASAVGLVEALPFGSATGQGVKFAERMLPAVKSFMHSPAGHAAVHFGEEATETAMRHKVYHDDMHKGHKKGGHTFSGNAWYGFGGPYDQADQDINDQFAYDQMDQTYPNVAQLPASPGSWNQGAANKKTFGTFDPKAPAASMNYNPQGLPDSREEDIVSPTAYDITGVNRFFGKMGAPAKPKQKKPFNPAKVADSLMDQTYGNPWSLYNMAGFASNVVDGINNRRDMKKAASKEMDNYSTMGLYAVQDPRQGSRGFRPVSGTQQNMDMPDQLSGVFSMQGMNQKYYNPFRAAEGMQIDSMYAPGETFSEFVPDYAPTSDSVVSKDIRENFAAPVKAVSSELPPVDSDLKDFIAQKESGGNYKALPKDRQGNLVSSAAGKYQFLWRQHKDWISKLTGITTKEDFLNNPEAQEKAFEYWDANTLTPAAQKIQKELNVQLPINQIKAKVHFAGANGAYGYFKSGKVVRDGFGTTTGTYDDGGEVEMSADEIMNFMAMGGEIEYLD